MPSTESATHIVVPSDQMPCGSVLPASASESKSLSGSAAADTMPGADSVAGTGDPTAAAAPLPDSRTTAAAAGASDITSTQAIQIET